MKNYFISIGILTVILVLISVFRAEMPFDLHSAFNPMLIFYTIQSVFIAGILYLAESKQENYGLIALGIVVLRLITALIFLMFMYVQVTEDAMLFAIQFMLIYLSYLVFELTVVLAKLRRN